MGPIMTFMDTRSINELYCHTASLRASIDCRWVIPQKSQSEKRPKRFWQVYIPMYFLLLAAIVAKLIGPHSGLQDDEENCKEIIKCLRINVLLQYPPFNPFNVIEIYKRCEIIIVIFLKKIVFVNF